jgi:hypothetical protein
MCKLDPDQTPMTHWCRDGRFYFEDEPWDYNEDNEDDEIACEDYNV